jgi:hypothetical protein
MSHDYKEIIKEEGRRKSFTGHLAHKLFLTMLLQKIISPVCHNSIIEVFQHQRRNIRSHTVGIRYLRVKNKISHYRG